MKSAFFRSGPIAVQTAITTAIDPAEDRQREAVIVAVALGDAAPGTARSCDVIRLPSW